MAYLGNAPVVGDSTNSFRLLDDIASFTLTFDATDTAVVSIANDTLSFRNHRFVTGQKVTYTDGGGTAIGGLTDGTSYFIIKVDQNTIKLATNASNAASSTAINLTSGAAGGAHTLNVKFDGVNTKFKATFNNGKKAKISRAGQISLSINGVIQQPQDSSSPSVGYGVEADSTIVFSTAPLATDRVFGTFIGEVAASFDIEDNTVDNFTGDGSTTIFNLSKEVPSSQDVLVTIDGVTQYPSDGSTTRSYSVVDQALTFVSAPADGTAIQARHIGFAGATTSAVTGFYGRTGNAALISTDDISVQNISAGIATFNTIAVGGTVSIGGTLTYEDVTNIDSVGLVTARNGIVVGSGITLSKDGDGFFTGIVTATTFSGALSGSGANITAINASNISSGTVPTARLGSGTASSSTFLRGDSTFQTVNTDLVSDTSPQLGGDLASNGNDINLADSDKINFGTGNDYQIFHDGSNSIQFFDAQVGVVRFRTDRGNSTRTNINLGAGVDLYYENNKKFETSSTGNQGTGVLKLISGNGSTSSDDNILHIVSGGTATRGIKIGTGRATGSSQNDGMGYIDAIDSESSGYGAQIQLRVNAARIINVGYQANKYVGINEDDPNYELVVAAQDTNESTLQILSGGNGKESNLLFGAPDDADVGSIKYDHNGDQMKFTVGTSEIFRANSNGICLGGTGSANGLDDYEEGTYTISLANVNAPTYEANGGTYVKIGKYVFVTGTIGVTGSNWSSDGSGFAPSLPFTAKDGSTINVSLGRYTNLLGSKASAFQNVRNTGAGFIMQEGNDSNIAYNEIASGGYLNFSASFMVA